MIRWCHHILKNPTRYIFLFYTLLVWRILAVYFGIQDLSLITVFLLTAICYVLYGAFKNISTRRRLPLSLGILLVCLPILSLLETHIIYALYRMENTWWSVDPAHLIALYPLLLLFLLMIQDRYFHPAGAVVSLPFVLFSWLVLIQDQLKAWIILYLFFTLIEAAGWVYTQARKKSRLQGLRMMPRKRMMATTTIVFVCLIPALFFPLSTLGTRSISDILDPEDAPAHYINEFDLHTLGYGDETALGGPIKLDDELLLTVAADSPLYLRGNVKDQYTGHAWQKTAEGYEKQREYAVHEINKDSRQYIDAETSRIEIYPAVDDANALFTPLNTIYIYTNAKVWYDRYYIFYNIGRRHRTDSYTVLYKDIAYDTQYDYFPESVHNTGIYGTYLQLPDTITQRTIDLVADITRGADTVSDKVAAIHKYLMDNYTYSLFMTNPPADVDFVDHFLFTEHKGYCTYFATSAAVMCRIAGVPSRYVQGFMLDPDKMTTESRYRLSGNEGHAWIEVLISPEDSVWATVECTPGRDTASGSSALLPELTPPPFGDGAVPIDLPDAPTVGHRGFIGKHLLLSILILLIGACLIAFIAIRINRRIRRWHSILTDTSILPLYRLIHDQLIPAGIFADPAMTDMDQAMAVTDGTLRGYLVPIVTQYYDEVYGGLRRDGGGNRREAYHYIVKYARRNKHK